MKRIIISILFFASILSIYSNTPTQTVKGIISDTDSKVPLIGATVTVMNSDPLIGVSTDIDGKFKLDMIPVGRISLKLSYIGYEDIVIPNIIVNSGKEVFLNLQMQESTVKLNEVTVSSQKQKGESTNDMVLLSSHTISLDESERFAGGFDDPSRVVTSFAGVSNTADGGSDIIVRGNAPKYVQWKINGTEVYSPYHYNDQNSSFGGLSTIKSSLLANSDFYTGAFAPEYGNVLSSVMDIKLRQGNSDKFEANVGVGLVGVDVGFEGPFKKGYGGSYLFNYRYSTIGLILDLGLVDMDALTSFQDATLNIVLPTKSIGKFTLFANGAKSDFTMDDVTPADLATPSDNAILIDSREDFDKYNLLLNSGLCHSYTLNNSSYIKTHLTYSAAGIEEKLYNSQLIRSYNDAGDLIDETATNEQLSFGNDLIKSTYKAASSYHNKINAKHKIQLGANYAIHTYQIKQNAFDPQTEQLATMVDLDKNLATAESYLSWKYRITDKITMVSGLHNMNVLYNGKSTIEPRFALNWETSEHCNIHLGYGEHSNMESIHHYFTKTEQADGSTIEPNKDLDLLKARHYTLGFSRYITENLQAKVELYYQDLYNLPVANDSASSFATINEGINYEYTDLVNEGTGKNYGIEVTLEKFFSNNYYFLFNTSIYESKYTALDGIERNTVFNKNYMANLLIGKEFPGLGKKDNQILGLNMKTCFEGGQRYLALLRDTEGNVAVDPSSNTYWDYANAYDKKMEDLYQINLSLSYKFNKEKTTHEIFLDIQNITDTRAKLKEYYDESEPNSVGYLKQFGIFPNLMYRVYF